MAAVTEEQIMEALGRDDNTGFCTACGEEHTVEPDAVDYECSGCGAHKVCGAEHLLLTTVV